MTLSPDTASDEDIAWLAAQFDAGRGSVFRSTQWTGKNPVRYHYPTLKVSSVNLDDIKRIAAIWGVQPHKQTLKVAPAGQQRWQARISGHTAVAWIRRLQPLLTGLAAAKFRGTLAVWDAQGGTGREW